VVDSLCMFLTNTMEQVITDAPYTVMRRYPAMLMGAFARQSINERSEYMVPGTNRSQVALRPASVLLDAREMCSLAAGVYACN